MKKIYFSLMLAVAIFSSQPALGWNGTGHIIVARIAWDNMTPKARKNVVTLLMQAPNDACLRDLFPNDSRPLEIRQREFFMLAATWPDVVRPGDHDTRPCIKYHQREWHFVDHFWTGISGDPAHPPTDNPKPIAAVNAVERLQLFRTFVVSSMPAKDRAMSLAWMLHLVGDIHQPLHTSGRITQFPTEKQGDGGGNAFKLAPDFSLHSYWDGIVDRADQRKPGESFAAYIDRVSNEFETANPKSSFSQPAPGNFDLWALESLTRAKNDAYPKTLKRNQMPGATYQAVTFRDARVSIAEAGYRLADLLNQLFGS